jgi:hypothetical protein
MLQFLVYSMNLNYQNSHDILRYLDSESRNERIEAAEKLAPPGVAKLGDGGGIYRS